MTFGDSYEKIKDLQGILSVLNSGLRYGQGDGNSAAILIECVSCEGIDTASGLSRWLTEGVRKSLEAVLVAAIKEVETEISLLAGRLLPEAKQIQEWAKIQ